MAKAVIVIQAVIARGSNCRGLIIRVQYNTPRWELSGRIFQVAIVLGGNCPGVIVLDGNCPGGIVLDGNCPGGRGGVP